MQGVGGSCTKTADCELGLSCFSFTCVDPESFWAEFDVQCVPDCADKVCGPDGCGGYCGGCASGWSCNGDGHCEELPNCELSLALACDETVDGSTIGRVNELQNYGCDEIMGTGPDIVYVFQPVIDDNVSLHLQSPGTGQKLLVTTSPCKPDSCADWNETEIQLEVNGGQKYYIVVDGDDEGGQFWLSLECQSTCVPQCAGLECGDDGCGGECGVCPAAVPDCVGGKCTVICDSDCTGKICGDDGCGGECTPGCLADEMCSPDQQSCLCQPDCSGKECGDDGCGGKCGECPDQGECVAGACAAPCYPDCGAIPDCQAAEWFGGNAYFLCKNWDVDWLTARSACAAHGAHLAIPDGSGENTFIFGLSGKNSWLGISDLAVEGVWMLVTGEQATWFNWGSGEPNNQGNEDCVEFVQAGKWNDIFCTKKMADFVCENDGLLCSTKCTGKECGGDGCGGICGVCPGGDDCVDGTCICTPSCAGKICGGDGCGGSCGECEPGKICSGNQKSCVIDDVCDGGAGLFQECQFDVDCASCWCAEHVGEGACTVGCAPSCPEGWHCGDLSKPGDPAQPICLSNAATLCRPCFKSGDCKSIGDSQDTCVEYGESGSFCGALCVLDEDCPEGYSCNDSQSTEGLPSKQCVADSGVCPCTAKSVAGGLWTGCTITNEIGSCEGKRVCIEGGLTDCDALSPDAELCDGIDNDCDGDVDEPVNVDGELVAPCDDLNQCTIDTCNGQQGCLHEVLNGVSCGDGLVCKEGSCLPGCLPACGVNEECVDGECVCAPDCTGVECGNDGCGGSCGACDGGYECGLAGQCEADCAALCQEVECGAAGKQDECDCGGCGAKLTCLDSICVTACQPKLLGTLDTPGDTRGVFAADGIAYVTDYGVGLHIVDVAQPANPKLLGSYEANTTGGSGTTGIQVVGDIAYLVVGTDGIEIVDVANPAIPALLGSFSGVHARGLVVGGGLAYVAADLDGLLILDVTNPLNPKFKAGYADPLMTAIDVFVADGVAYVVAKGEEMSLRTIDVAEPTSPNLAGVWGEAGLHARGVSVAEGMAYLPGGTGLHLLDVILPATAELVSSWTAGGPSAVVAASVEGDLAVTVGPDAGLSVIDIATPEEPSLYGSYQVLSNPDDVHLEGGLAYVADWSEGLKIIDLSSCIE